MSAEALASVLSGALAPGQSLSVHIPLPGARRGQTLQLDLGEVEPLLLPVLEDPPAVAFTLAMERRAGSLVLKASAGAAGMRERSTPDRRARGALNLGLSLLDAARGARTWTKLTPVPFDARPRLPVVCLGAGVEPAAIESLIERIQVLGSAELSWIPEASTPAWLPAPPPAPGPDQEAWLGALALGADMPGGSDDAVWLLLLPEGAPLSVFDHPLANALAAGDERALLGLLEELSAAPPARGLRLLLEERAEGGLSLLRCDLGPVRPLRPDDVAPLQLRLDGEARSRWLALSHRPGGGRWHLASVPLDGPPAGLSLYSGERRLARWEPAGSPPVAMWTEEGARFSGGGVPVSVELQVLGPPWFTVDRASGSRGALRAPDGLAQLEQRVLARGPWGQTVLLMRSASATGSAAPEATAPALPTGAPLALPLAPARRPVVLLRPVVLAADGRREQVPLPDALLRLRAGGGWRLQEPDIEGPTLTAADGPALLRALDDATLSTPGLEAALWVAVLPRMDGPPLRLHPDSAWCLLVVGVDQLAAATRAIVESPEFGVGAEGGRQLSLRWGPDGRLVPEIVDRRRSLPVPGRSSASEAVILDVNGEELGRHPLGESGTPTGLVPLPEDAHVVELVSRGRQLARLPVSGDAAQRALAPRRVMVARVGVLTDGELVRVPMARVNAVFEALSAQLGERLLPVDLAGPPERLALVIEAPTDAHDHAVLRLISQIGRWSCRSPGGEDRLWLALLPGDRPLQTLAASPTALALGLCTEAGLGACVRQGLADPPAVLARGPTLRLIGEVGVDRRARIIDVQVENRAISGIPQGSSPLEIRVHAQDRSLLFRGPATVAHQELPVGFWALCPLPPGASAFSLHLGEVELCAASLDLAAPRLDVSRPRSDGAIHFGLRGAAPWTAVDLERAVDGVRVHEGQVPAEDGRIWPAVEGGARRWLGAATGRGSARVPVTAHPSAPTAPLIHAGGPGLLVADVEAPSDRLVWVLGAPELGRSATLAAGRSCRPAPGQRGPVSLHVMDERSPLLVLDEELSPLVWPLGEGWPRAAIWAGEGIAVAQASGALVLSTLDGEIAPVDLPQSGELSDLIAGSDWLCASDRAGAAVLLSERGTRRLDRIGGPATLRASEDSCLVWRPGGPLWLWPVGGAPPRDPLADRVLLAEISADGARLALLCGQTIFVYSCGDIGGWAQLQAAGVERLALDRGGKRLAAASAEQLWLWTLQPTPDQPLAAPRVWRHGLGSPLALHLTSERIAVVGAAAVMAFTADSDETASFPAPAVGVEQIASQGDALAWAGGGELARLNLRTGALSRARAPGRVHQLALDAAGRLLVLRRGAVATRTIPAAS